VAEPAQGVTDVFADAKEGELVSQSLPRVWRCVQHASWHLQPQSGIGSV